MNVFRRVATQSMRRNRTRTIVTIIGVILSAAMFTAVTTFAATIVKHLERSEAYESGTYYLSLLDVNADAATAMRMDDETDALTAAEVLGYVQLDAPREGQFLYVTAMDADFPELMPVHLVSGRMPTNSSELLVPVHLLADGELMYDLGDTLELTLGYRMCDGQRLWQDNPFNPEGETFASQFTRTYTVVGVIERPDFEDYSSPGYTALTVQNDVPVTGIYDVYVRTKDCDTERLDSYTSRYIDASEGGGSYNWDYLLTQGNFRFNNFNRFVSTFVMILVFLIMLGSVSLIYSAFSISVSERTRQFGLLSSVGATRKQLRKTVLYEAGVVSLVGIPLGLLAGCGGMWITFALLGDRLESLFGNDVQILYYVSPLSLVLAAVIALTTVFISATIPARRAMRVSAIEAIRQSRDVKLGRRDISSGKLAYRLFGLPGMLSAKYFRRSRKKYRATIVSLAMSVLLFVSASTYGMYLTEAIGGSANMSPYDFLYENPTLTCADLDGILADLRQAPGIEAAYYAVQDGREVMVTASDYSKGYLDFYGQREQQGYPGVADSVPYCRFYYLDEQTFDELLAEAGLTRADYDARPGALLLDRVSRIYYGEGGENRYVYDGAMLRSGLDSLQIISYEDREGYAYSHTEIEDGAFISYYYRQEESPEDDEPYRTFPAATWEQPVLGRVERELAESDELCLYFPVSAPEAESTPTLCCVAENHDAAKSSIGKVFQDNGVSFSEDDLYDVWESTQTERNILTVVQVFSYGFIILISLICVANVFNTISTNVALRRRDFAMLRSVGMTRGGLNRMVCFECVLYGIRALLIGLPLAALLSYLMYNAAAGMHTSSFRLSWPAVAIAVISVFLVVFVSMMYAMRKIKRDNPVDALKEENV